MDLAEKKSENAKYKMTREGPNIQKCSLFGMNRMSGHF